MLSLGVSPTIVVVGLLAVLKQLSSLTFSTQALAVYRPLVFFLTYLAIALFVTLNVVNYWLLVLLLPACYHKVFAWGKLLASNRCTSAEPPFVSSWIPWLGAAFFYGLNPLKYLEQMHKENGPIFTLHVAGTPMTVIVPTDATQPFYDLFYRASNEEMSFFLPLENARLPEIIGRSFASLDESLMGKITRKLIPRFSRLASDIDAEVQYLLDKHLTFDDKGEGNLELWSFSDSLILGMSALTLCRPLARNDEVLHLMKRLEELAQKLIISPGIIGEPILFQVRPIRARLHTILRAELHRRINERASADPDVAIDESKIDLMDIMMETTPNDEQLIIDAIVGFLFGAVANTNAALVYILAHAAADHTHLASAEAEVKTTLANVADASQEYLESSNLTGMKFVEALLLEVSRMYPIVLSMRTTRIPVDLNKLGCGPYTVPANRVVAVSSALAMRNPEHFPQPDKFIPTRWLESGAASAQRNYCFGQGRHMCKGMLLAKMEIKTVLARLLSRVELTAVTGDLTPSGVPEMNWVSLGLAYPKNSASARLHYRRRTQPL